MSVLRRQGVARNPHKLNLGLTLTLGCQLSRRRSRSRHVASQQHSCGIAAHINSSAMEFLEHAEARAYLRGTLHRNME